jgi:TPR repeat protein
MTLIIILKERCENMQNEVINFSLFDFITASSKNQRKDGQKEMMFARLLLKTRPEKAVELLKKSAKEMNTDACFLLGKCFENGYGTKRNYKNAIKYYSCVDGHVTNDIWGNPDPVGKIEDAHISRYLNNEEYAGIVNECADLIAPDYEEDFDAQLLLAVSGDADAQNIVGHRYFYGQGVEKNIDKAIYWCEQSALQGNEAAAWHLADFYFAKGDFKNSAHWHGAYAEMRILWRNKRLLWD